VAPGRAVSSQDCVHVLLFCNLAPAAQFACNCLSFGTYLPHRDRHGAGNRHHATQPGCREWLSLLGLAITRLTTGSTMSSSHGLVSAATPAARSLCSAGISFRSTSRPHQLPIRVIYRKRVILLALAVVIWAVSEAETGHR